MGEHTGTDDGYEGERGNAESEFADGHDSWLTESTLDPSAGVWALAERCRDFLWDDLRAYCRFVQRQNIPPSQRVSLLESHKEETVAETRRRKWLPGVAEIAEFANVGDSPEQDWETVSQYTEYYLRQRLEPQLWSSVTATSSSSEAVGGKIPDPQGLESRMGGAENRDQRSNQLAMDRRNRIADFKSRARVQGIKVTDAMIAKAAKPGHWSDRTPITRWKRNDPRSTPPDDRLIQRLLTKNPSDVWPPS